MRVLDHEPHAWYLLENDGVLYLDAHCSHSAFDYSVLIALNADERATYSLEGRLFLGRLADNIHYSAPAAKGSMSPFKSRNLAVLDRQTSEMASSAISRWQSATSS